MIFKSEFKIDLFQLKHTKDPEGLLEATKQYYAAAFGRHIISLCPYVKDEEKSFQGELPQMSLNKEHEFNDYYRSEFMILSLDDWQLIKQYLPYEVGIKLSTS